MTTSSILLGLTSILEDFVASKYVGMMLDPEQAKEIYAEVESRLGPVDLEPGSRYHTTIIYSKAPINSDVPLENVHYSLATGEYALFGAENDTLVMLIQSPSLNRDHEYIKSSTGAVPTYDEYSPHITLKYNATTSDLLNIMDYKFTRPLRYSVQDTGQNSY